MINGLPPDVYNKWKNYGVLPLVIIILSSGDNKKVQGLVDVLSKFEMSVEGIIERI